MCSSSAHPTIFLLNKSSTKTANSEPSLVWIVGSCCAVHIGLSMLHFVVESATKNNSFAPQERHSTVTLLAKFLGLSTSVPLASAV